MSDLVGNPEDRFSRVEAQMSQHSKSGAPLHKTQNKIQMRETALLKIALSTAL